MIGELARQIIERRVLLFAGAGVSASLGLPSWSELMACMARDLGHDPAVLIRPGADYLQIAEYYRLEKGNLADLRRWMDENWNIPDEMLLKSRAHNQIVDIGFPLIYTTNYDRNIERIFALKGRRFATIRSVLDVAIAANDLTHIVKFHGDFGDEQSLVLTESDYFERLRFESPLDVKFRADALGRSILFVGYSLSDLNLRLLLYRLQQTWANSPHADRRPPSYIFLLDADPVQERVWESRGIRTIVSTADDPNDALPDFFNALLEQIRALRQQANDLPRARKSLSFHIESKWRTRRDSNS